MTTLNFEPIRRSDNGVYRLVIENDCPALPQNQRQAEDSFQIHVSGGGRAGGGEGEETAVLFSGGISKLLGCSGS